MDTNQTPGPESEETPEDSDIRNLMDRAAQAYMDGDYSVAVGAWREILDVDPANPRAREGIKKVSMLQSEGDGEDEPPFDPVLEEIEDLLQRRRFEEALSASHKHAKGAGPALRTALRKLEQRAEHARAIEPEIMRCMANARRSLQAGNVSEALPHLKQALSLDRTHPVARRLMDGLRQRARRRHEEEGGGAAPPRTPASKTATVASVEELQDLPSTGNPGSDAPPRGRSSPSSGEPAPLGRGLPSSPVGRGSDPSAPEIDLDMLSPAEETETTAAEDGEEIIAGAPMAIELQDEEPATGVVPPGTTAQATSTFDSRRGAAGGNIVEAPFKDLDDVADLPTASDAKGSQAPVSDPSPPATAPAAAGADAIPEMTENDLAAVLRSNRKEVAAAPVIPRDPGRSIGGRSPMVWGGMTAVVLLAALVAAWQMGWLFSTQSDFGGPPDSGHQTVATDPVPATEDAAPSAPTPEPGNQAEVSVVTAEGNPGSSVDDARQALMLLEQGQDLFIASRPTAALEVFRRAQALDPVNGEISSWVTRTENHLQQQGKQEADHEAAVAAFERKDFELALRGFYRMEDKGGDQPYKRYIANSWYNWGLQLLAAGNLREAAKKMDEVLTIQPNDDQAGAIKKLVTSYSKKAKDRKFFQQIEALHYRLLDS
ncbi:MAG: hypothetical protein O7F11_04635 [Acidobacteria bacterium]|nr:hypothetical protein [Acidobacteriota bacterium]